MFAVVWFPSPHNPHDEESSQPSLYNGNANQGYFQEITLLDEQLGRLRQWLRDEGIHQNTLIWYCSDNGGLLTASSGGRGKKAATWEGGLRVPGIMEWPLRNLTGASNVPVVTSDMYPTLLALTGIAVENPLPLDGIDIREIIEGTRFSRPGIGFWTGFQGGQSTDSDAILSAIRTKQQNGDPLPHNASRIRKDVDEFPQFTEATSVGNVAWLEWPWKLHRRSDGADYQLYNLETDPDEAFDLFGDPLQAVRADDMQAALHAWQASSIRSINGADYGRVPLWLPMNSTTGTAVFDADGSLRGDVLNVGNPTSHWVPGRHNMALALDGVSNEVDVPNAYLFPPVGANARTIATWIKTVGSGRVAEWGDVTIDGGFWNVGIDVSGFLTLDVGNGSITGGTDLRDGGWHHVAVVFPGPESPNVTDVVLYVNGTAEVPSASSTCAIRTSNSGALLGGARSRWWLVIDEFRIFPQALDAADIAALYAATNQAAAAWHYRYYGAVAPVDWLADTEPDGVNNLQEYAFGGNPLVPDFVAIRLIPYYNRATRRFEVSFARRREGTHDLVYTAQGSTDLHGWDVPLSVKSVEPYPTPAPGALDRVTLHSDVTASETSVLHARVRAALAGD